MSIFCGLSPDTCMRLHAWLPKAFKFVVCGLLFWFLCFFSFCHLLVSFLFLISWSVIPGHLQTDKPNFVHGMKQYKLKT